MTGTSLTGWEPSRPGRHRTLSGKISNSCRCRKGSTRQKRVGILGLGFPPAWRDREQLAVAMEDRTSGTLDETIKGSPAVLVVVYDTRKRAPASEGDVLGILSLGCVMENMGAGYRIPGHERIQRSRAGGCQESPGDTGTHGNIVCGQARVPRCTARLPEGAQGQRIVHVPQCVWDNVFWLFL